MEQIIPLSEESQYGEILRQAVAVIETARSKAASAIVGTSNEMHWEIGKLLYERKLDSKHGDSVVKRLSGDLKARFPKMGMSVTNLWDMKRYYVRFRESDPKLRHAVGVLPWWNINKLIAKVGEDDEAMLYYAEQTIVKKWNRDMMVNAIKMEMHLLQPETNLSNNFAITLPEMQAAYANEVFKDSYCMGFLGVTEPILELELERRLVEKIKQFLLELGQGFTYIGNQHVLSYNGKDENPSIGIILCAAKDNVDVELALDGYHKPIGVAEYQLIVPQKELKQLISDEIESFNKEIQQKTD